MASTEGWLKGLRDMATSIGDHAGQGVQWGKKVVEDIGNQNWRPAAAPAQAQPQPQPAAPATIPTSTIAPGMSGRAQRRAEELEQGPRPTMMNGVRSDAGPGLEAPLALAAAGGATGFGKFMKQGRAGLRKAATSVGAGIDKLKQMGPGGIGQAAGQAVNSAEALADDAARAAADAKTGYNRARTGQPVPGKPHFIAADYARATESVAGGAAPAAPAQPAAPLSRTQQALDAMKAQGKVTTDALGGAADAAKKAGASGLRAAGAVVRRVPGIEQAYNVADASSRAASEGLTRRERVNEGLRGVVKAAGTTLGTIGGGIGGAGLGTLVAPGPGTAVGAVTGMAGGAELGRRAGGSVAEWMLGPEKGVGVVDRVLGPEDAAAAGQQAGQAGQTGGQGGTQSGSIGQTPNPKITTAPGLDAAGIIGRNDATGLRSGEGAIQGPRGLDVFMPGGPRGRGVPGPAATPEERNQAAWEVLQLENQIQSNRALASPEAGGTGISVGGLRGRAMSTGGSGGRFDDAFDALANLQGYGAASRLAKNDAELGVKRGELQAKSDANRLAGVKTRLEIAKEQRSTEAANEEQFSKTLEGRARQKLGDPMVDGDGKVDPAYESKVKTRSAKLLDEYRHTAANMRDAAGNKQTLGTLTQGQVQQIHMMDDIRNKLEKAREGLPKKIKDYMGTKRADSRDLNDYQPVGYEKSSMPGVAKWIVLKTGEKVPVTEIAGGGFTIFGPNDPMDKQLLEMADAAEARKGSKGR